MLLDTKLNPDLINEGLAREAVNRIQTLRKDSGLNVSDRINVSIVSDANLTGAVSAFDSYVRSETLCLKLDFDGDSANAKNFTLETDIEGYKAKISLSVASVT